MILAIVLSVVGVVVLVVVGVAAFALRRSLVQRPGGTFDCSLRVHPQGRPVPAPVEGAEGTEDAAAQQPVVPVDHGKGWVFGIGRYSGDQIDWFRVFSYSPRPRRTMERYDIEVVGKRLPVGQEELALLAGSVVLECRHRQTDIELAMSDDALTGFLAWLEAAPPGQRVNVA
jgi:hypothetical protein